MTNLEYMHPDAAAILTSCLTHEEKAYKLWARKAHLRIRFKDGDCIHTGEDLRKCDGKQYSGAIKNPTMRKFFSKRLND